MEISHVATASHVRCLETVSRMVDIVAEEEVLVNFLCALCLTTRITTAAVASGAPTARVLRRKIHYGIPVAAATR